MGAAKKLKLKPISSADANAIIRALHYSGKVCPKSQLHFGVFLNGTCGGALSFGPSMDKRKLIGLVSGTRWNGFLELNRMALADWLPKNCESRAIAVAMRLIRQNYRGIEWVVTFADGCQCGDGTIYRASGFVLTGITRNSTIYAFPDGERVSDLGIKTGHAWQRRKFGRVYLGYEAMRQARAAGAERIAGYQLRYIYFVNPEARNRLAVPVIPFSEIAARGAAMYRGERRAGSADSGTSAIHAEGGGANPTSALLVPSVVDTRVHDG